MPRNAVIMDATEIDQSDRLVLYYHRSGKITWKEIRSSPKIDSDATLTLWNTVILAEE
jgi:hypothetical protein